MLSLTGHPDPERFVAEFTGSNRAVAEYLVAEMFERQPEDVQNLLLRTSILRRVNGELADLLRLELRRILPDEVRDVHRTAAAWLTDHAHTVEAVRHLQAAGDWPEAAEEFAAAHELQSQLSGRHALTGYVIGWLLATLAGLGSFAGARSILESLGSPPIDSGEIRNGRAVICLAEGTRP